MPDTQQTCELRAANELDFDEIAEIWHSSASLEGVGPPVMPTIEELRQRVDLEIANGWMVTVAVVAGKLTAFCAIKPGEAILDQLFVSPNAIGCGIGNALLRQAMDAMPEGFTLHTASSNTLARQFYERAGLMFLHEGPHPRTGHPVSHYGWRSAEFRKLPQQV